VSGKRAVTFALLDGDHVLMEWRDDRPFNGKWSFPGGKVEPGEHVLDALYREAREELGIDIILIDTLTPFEYNRWTLSPYRVNGWTGVIRGETDAGHRLAWVPLDRAVGSPWYPAGRIAREIKERLCATSEGTCSTTPPTPSASPPTASSTATA
jgi:8-oxo-dGTP pyrophosphatase MutT (NUDIX family)